MTEKTEFGDDLNLALELASLASEVALPLFRAGVTPKEKPDGSWVTVGDLEVERRLLETLSQKRPDDAVLSEESGALGTANRRWILDPIDGTSYFASARNSWGTHVALEVDGDVVLGVITRPVAGQWWWAVKGGGAYRAALGSRSAAETLRVSDIFEPAHARVMVWSNTERPFMAALRERKQWLDPTIDGILELAAGRVDALVDYHGCPWDIAPAIPIVEEAGGRFFDRNGGRSLNVLGGWFTNGRVDAAFRALEGS